MPNLVENLLPVNGQEVDGSHKIREQARIISVPCVAELPLIGNASDGAYTVSDADFTSWVRVDESATGMSVNPRVIATRCSAYTGSGNNTLEIQFSTDGVVQYGASITITVAATGSQLKNLYADNPELACCPFLRWKFTKASTTVTAYFNVLGQGSRAQVVV